MQALSVPASRSYTEAEIDQALTYAMAHNAVRDALLCHARGDFVQPLKPYVRPGGRENEFTRGRFIAMPGYVGGNLNAVGVKWICSMPSNGKRGLPRASGRVLLNDPVTAVEIASMECATLSARRTAAVVTVCAEYLAPIGPLTVALIGAGPIATETARALLCLRDDIIEIRLFDLRSERSDRLLTLLQPRYGVRLQRAESAEAAVKDANLIVPATTGASGYLKLSWLAPSWLLVALSLDDCEPEVLLNADRVIVDDFDQCNREEKLLARLVQQGRLSRDRVYAQLGQIVAGERPGSGVARTYVNPMGMAILDLAVAVRVYRATAGGESSLNRKENLHV